MIWANALLQGVMLGGLYALAACGLSLIFGVMGVINLAHGDLIVLAGYALVVILAFVPLPPLLAMVLVVPLFFALGYVAQRTLIQASLDRGPLTTLLVTFGVSIVIENVLLEVFSADSHSVDLGALTTASIQLNDQIYLAYISIGILALAVAVLLTLQLMLSRSGIGRRIRAVADDREAAQLAGISYRHVFALASGVALSTIALAGVAFAAYSSFAPASGPSRLLFAFEAVVIGGLGSLWGTLVGGIILGVAQTIGSTVDPSLGVLSGHLVFLLVLAARPEGIARRRATA